MKIRKSKIKSRIKSFTKEGEKAITCSYLYKCKHDKTPYIMFTTLFFSKNLCNDEYIRDYKGKHVYKRETAFKYDTLIRSLENLKVISKLNI